MTTIAYKDGVIAADGRIRTGDRIVTDSRVKMIRLGSGAAFTCGSDRVLDDLEAAGEIGVGRCVNCDEWNALFVDEHGDVHLCGSDDGVVWMARHRDDEPMAIGSGSDFAIAAMDMGASPKEAVEAAARRDSATGGEIRE